jgi:hypothetical protein
MRPEGGHLCELCASHLCANPVECIEVSMKRILLGTIALLCLTGCSQTNPSPETIRQDTAKATNEVVRDAKAVAKGVSDGIKEQKTSRGAIDINKASASDLETLPGVDTVRAQKIIDGRPYDDPTDLVKKHIVSKSEFDRISGQIAAQ